MSLEEGSMVFPGEIITNAEGLKAGRGTVTINGKLVSTITGFVRFNKETRLVWIDPIKQPIFPRRNDLVLGEVISVGNSIANVKIWFIIKIGKSPRNLKLIPLKKPFSANLHISQLGVRTESLSKMIKTGDILISRIVMDYTLPVNIVINDKLLGVVAARCSTCGTPLIKKKELFCPKCNKVESRKVSELYNYEKFMNLIKIHKPKRYLIVELE